MWGFSPFITVANHSIPATRIILVIPASRLRSQEQPHTRTVVPPTTPCSHGRSGVENDLRSMKRRKKKIKGNFEKWRHWFNTAEIRISQNFNFLIYVSEEFSNYSSTKGRISGGKRTLVWFLRRGVWCTNKCQVKLPIWKPVWYLWDNKNHIYIPFSAVFT